MRSISCFSLGNRGVSLHDALVRKFWAKVQDHVQSSFPCHSRQCDINCVEDREPRISRI